MNYSHDNFGSMWSAILRVIGQFSASLYSFGSRPVVAVAEVVIGMSLVGAYLLPSAWLHHRALQTTLISSRHPLPSQVVALPQWVERGVCNGTFVCILQQLISETLTDTEWCFFGAECC